MLYYGVEAIKIDPTVEAIMQHVEQWREDIRKKEEEIVDVRKKIAIAKEILLSAGMKMEGEEIHKGSHSLKQHVLSTLEGRGWLSAPAINELMGNRWQGDASSESQMRRLWKENKDRVERDDDRRYRLLS